MTREFTRRDAITTIGTGGAVVLAGCAGSSGSGSDGDGSSGNESSASGSSGGNQSGGAGTTSGGGGSSKGPGAPLTAGGSSTVYPITSTGASIWVSNPPAGDEDYWVPKDYNINSKKNFADYWAGLYGVESQSDGPPFQVSVGLSHSDVGLTQVQKGQVDIGDASAPVESELTDLSKSEYKKFKNHVVGVDGQPVVVSKAIYDAGVKKLTLDQIRKIYKGKIENWSEISSYSGDSQEIQVVGRVEGSGTDTSFRSNVFGSGDAKIPGVDVRKGENQQVQTLVSQSNNAIAYLALAFTGEDDPAVAIEANGKTYKNAEDFGQSDYPLSRDLHCYTYDGTSKKEAAFLRMILSDYGQKNLVAANDYIKLPKNRQKEEIGKLPSANQ